MKITLRLISSLVLVLTFVVVVFTVVQVREESAQMLRDMDARALVLAESMGSAVEQVLDVEKNAPIQALLDRYGRRGPGLGVAVFSAGGDFLAGTRNLRGQLGLRLGAVDAALETGAEVHDGITLPNGKRYRLLAVPLLSGAGNGGALVIFQNTAQIDVRRRTLWRYGFFRLLAQVLLVSLATLLIIHMNLLSPLYAAVDWLKQLRIGDSGNAVPVDRGVFGPLLKEAHQLASSLQSARMAVAEEARLRHTQDSIWTAGRLREHVKSLLGDRPIFVVSNREPYMHVRRGRAVDCIVPAGGMVTAMEPVLRACGGTWIAHGAGDADTDMVDASDRLRVPPDDPQYTLRRIWLDKEEENGYYYGLSNEGIWPLCHIAHTRPIFRPEDWTLYEKVNRKFADAVLSEVGGVAEPCILIQDYHLALLPRMLKEARPDARIALFWHIPWPNPESFGICPWARDILHGMLGADLLGFHIQYHCNNFLDTVDRLMESRIDWERFVVNRKQHATLVRPFPISIDLPLEDGAIPSGVSKAQLLKEYGIKADLLGVGVDRIDYTKGLVERFLAVERFFVKYPDYVGRFTFVELGAPSRTLIQRYHDLNAEVEAEATRINWRFKTKDWQPILFLKKHHSHSEIMPFYKAADVCMVTSLHDGMNLVAKEYVAARADGDGSLILSGFAGASRELRDALIVNPYDIDKMADALKVALDMDAGERRLRMERMRQTLRENNIYRWAGNMVAELTAVRGASKPATPAV